jgi:hypothetical protein
MPETWLRAGILRGGAALGIEPGAKLVEHRLGVVELGPEGGHFGRGT